MSSSALFAYNKVMAGFGDRSVIEKKQHLVGMCFLVLVLLVLTFGGGEQGRVGPGILQVVTCGVKRLLPHCFIFYFDSFDNNSILLNSPNGMC